MDSSQRNVLFAAMLVTLVTGSIHSFSVLLQPIESRLGISRSETSLVYSIALVCLTLSVLFGYRIYSRIPPPILTFFTCLIASAGLAVSAAASSWWALVAGYSIIFGSANGMAYGYVLQLAGRVVARRKGFAMAAVTASYAFGSVIFSILLARIIAGYSLFHGLAAMALIISGGGFCAAVLLHNAQARFGSVKPAAGEARKTRASLALWWCAYGCSVFAGLMAIGHAAGIVESAGGQYLIAVWGAAFIGIGSAAGGVVIGLLLGTDNILRCLVTLSLASATALAMLTIAKSAVVAIFLLAAVGFAYGALISVYPYAVSTVFGDQQGPRVYGRIFTAWGFSGLLGPWLAGKIHDHSGSYEPVLLLASSIALAATFLSVRLFRPGKVS